MTDNTSFVKYLIIGGIVATFAVPFVCAWLDWRDEKKKEGGRK